MHPAAKFRPIATEEAFVTPEIIAAGEKLAAKGGDHPDAALWKMLGRTETFKRRLLDLETERLSIMDEHGVAMQLLAVNSPGVQMFEAAEAASLVTRANDLLAQTIARHPTRYAGLASIAPQDPAFSVREIERAITKLKLNGVMINSHTNDEFLDNPKFRPILEAIAEIGVPLYIHPRAPSQQMIAPFRPGLELAIWGYQADTSLHAMRMILQGVFEDIPKLKVVLGHAGEGIPFWLNRVDVRYAASAFNARKLPLKPSEYFQRNFWITTSGMNWDPVLKYCVGVMGADKILFAVDYPFEETKPAIEGLLNSSLSDADKMKIFSTNTEGLFGISTNG